MKDRWQPILGGVLVIVGVISLLAVPKEFSLVHVLVFILCWTFGVLLCLGLVGTHPAAALQRRLVQENGGIAPFTRPEIAERTFSYGARPWHRAMAVMVCVLMGTGFILCGIVVECMTRIDLGARLFSGMALALFGVFFCCYGWRYLKVRFRISPEGIEARLYFRTVRIRWDEVVALVTRQVWIPFVGAGGAVPVVLGLNAGKMFWVYSGRDKLWFSGQLVGAAELAELISQATGLQWT